MGKKMVQACITKMPGASLQYTLVSIVIEGSEIIWGNKPHRGDEVSIDPFPGFSRSED